MASAAAAQRGVVGGREDPGVEDRDDDTCARHRVGQSLPWRWSQTCQSRALRERSRRRSDSEPTTPLCDRSEAATPAAECPYSGRSARKRREGRAQSAPLGRVPPPRWGRAHNECFRRRPG
eukprot:365262-Chlamydomonas_euryale.AAC.3